MAHYQLYPILLVGCFAYALVLGGAPERLGVAIILICSCITVLVMRPQTVRFAQIEWGVVWVDVAVLVGFFVLALMSTRHWPQWIAAIQILQVASHFVATVPGTIRLAYAMAISLLVYPMLAILFVGTTLHWLRKRAYGADPSWRRWSGRYADLPQATLPPSS